MRQRLKAIGNFEVRREYGRIFVAAKSYFDYDEAVNGLTKIFGISGVCPVMEIDSLEYKDISEGVIKLPYEDCCTIFVAKHPVTKPTLEQIKKSEENLVGIIEPLYETALETAEVVYLK